MRTLLACLFVVTACAPGWQDDAAFVTSARIIAVEAQPPEAEPGTRISLHAVIATPTGPGSMPVSWSPCQSPKPAGENGAVNPSCITEPPSAPSGPAIELVLPAGGCRLFGPETPPRVGNDPPLRPRDADETGGYQQPVRATLNGQVTIASVRLACPLVTAPIEIAADFRQRYRKNQNPAAPAIFAVVDGAPVALDALPAGRAIAVTARWQPEDAESFLAFDPASQTLRERREAMRITWFTSAGRIATPRAGRIETDRETTAVTSFQSDTPGNVHLWAILQDSRGGLATSHILLTVR
jgi:hypothetical protein